MKILVLEAPPETKLSTTIIDLNEKKQYIISDKIKTIVVKETNSLSVVEGIQYELARFY